LGPLGKLDLNDIEWVIVGGESGFCFRDCRVEWVKEIRNQCIEAGVPFFFKQWGGITSKARGRDLEGMLWNEFPKLHSTEIIQTTL
jgi:protein gp37